MSTASRGKYWIGFDLGGTKMMAGVFDARFKMLGSARKRTRAEDGAAEGVRRMAATIEEALESAGLRPSRIGAIGVGCPGPLDLERGVVLHMPNLGWKNVPLRRRLERLFKRPAYILNDVDAGTYGEYVAGAARDARSVLGVFPGTGIGGGFIYEGRLLRGANQSCMEIGHMKVQHRGRLCGCGRRGCLETIASRLAISAEAAAAVYRGEAPALAKIAGPDLSRIRSNALAQAIRKGDRAVEAIVRQAASFLGLAIANAINLLAPDRVVLGGGLIEALGRIVVPETREAVNDQVMDAFKGTFRIVTASLGDLAGVTGAAAIAARPGALR